MGQLVRFPAAEGSYDRLTEQQRLANIKAEQAEAVKIARAVLRAPERYTEDNLRDACVALRRWGDGFDHLTADAMVYAINRREQIARNRAKQTPAQIASTLNWPKIIAYGAVGAAIILAFTGWL
jgi:hypothetical protein